MAKKEDTTQKLIIMAGIFLLLYAVVNPTADTILNDLFSTASIFLAIFIIDWFVVHIWK